MNIMEVVPQGISSQPNKYYIDIEVDIEMFPPETRRIEIPRRLAIYIQELQRDIALLQNQNHELLNKINRNNQ